jgi:acyl carrier protein
MQDPNRNQSLEQDIHQKVVSLVAEVLQIEITPNVENLVRKDTAEWDSINHLRLALELEDLFGISLAEDRWADIVSLREIEIMLSECSKESQRSDNI